LLSGVTAMQRLQYTTEQMFSNISVHQGLFQHALHKVCIIKCLLRVIKNQLVQH